MSKILDFKIKHTPKVFAIDPDFSKPSGLSWSIINQNAQALGGQKNVPVIHRSGLLKPFVPVDNLNYMNEMSEKFTAIWRNDSGYSQEPAVVVVKQPVLSTHTDMKNTQVADLLIFIGMLLCTLSPRLTLVPTTNEWKEKNNQISSKEEIEAIDDYHSKKSLERDLSMIASYDRFNIYNALSIGLYGANVDSGKITPPRLFFRAPSLI